MKLKLSTAIQSKIKYFNSRFPSKEWSGPAWYSVQANDNGFPEEFGLQHFHPLDLGHGTSTEWEASDLAKVLKQTYEKFPKLKKCYMGLIHSHHTMGAFFSGTDTSTLEDMAPEKGFYASLVVATHKDPFAFAFAYKDQYGQASVIEIDEDDITGVVQKARPEWIDVADGIEKDATTVTTFIGKGGQTSFLTPGHRPGYGHYATDNGLKKKSDYTDKEGVKVDALVQDMKDSKVTWYEFKESMENEGLDPFDYWEERADVSGYGYYNGFYDY